MCSCVQLSAVVRKADLTWYLQLPHQLRCCRCVLAASGQFLVAIKAASAGDSSNSPDQLVG
jgi:hypothetical protein